MQLQYTITKTWDNKPISHGSEVTVTFKKSDYTGYFVVEVEAPFHDNPRLPPDTAPGRVDGLWDYEVVEIFFLGSNDKYLEIELGPRGHYLVYYLEGAKKVTKNDLLLKSYKAEISNDGRRWRGEATISTEYLPPNTSKFNAYAIHGSDPHRVYMALFPVENGIHEQPNFHRLDPFSEIDLCAILS